jgi:hypothetical protein
MTTNRRMQSALRASLEKEDAALSRRLPAVAKSGTPKGRSKATTAATATVGRSKNAATPATAREPVEKPAAPTARRGRTSAQRKVATPAMPLKSRSRPTAPAAPAANAAPKARSPAKAEKRVRRTFSIAASDVGRLDSLKAAVAASGRKCRRSSLVRAGLALLERQDAAAVAALVDALPAIRKKGRVRK